MIFLLDIVKHILFWTTKTQHIKPSYIISADKFSIHIISFHNLLQHPIREMNRVTTETNKPSQPLVYYFRELATSDYPNWNLITDKRNLPPYNAYATNIAEWARIYPIES